MLSHHQPGAELLPVLVFIPFHHVWVQNSQCSLSLPLRPVPTRFRPAPTVRLRLSLRQEGEGLLGSKCEVSDDAFSHGAVTQQVRASSTRGRRAESLGLVPAPSGRATLAPAVFFCTCSTLGVARGRRILPHVRVNGSGNVHVMRVGSPSSGSAAVWADP